MKWISAILSIVLASASMAKDDKFDLLALPGQEKCAHPAMPAGEMVPFSQAVKNDSGLWRIVNPERRKFLSVGFAEVPLEPGAVYRFRMRAAGREGLDVVAFSSSHGEKGIPDCNLLHTRLFLNVNGVTEYSKLFAMVPGQDRITPYATFFQGGREMSPGTLCLLEELSIERVGEMKRPTDAERTVNLAADLDFSKFPDGNFEPMRKGMGPNAKKWSDILAEVVTMPDGAKALRIARTKANYVYPHLELAPFPSDPQFHYVKVSFEAKGRGSFRIGLWWKRRHMEWDYENASSCMLSDEWRTFTMIRPCMTPDVMSPTLAFNSSDDGEYFIRNIRVSFDDAN
ncbi:MAG: hypothetical protein MJ025_07155 [Victivallaceae bacterium]|nr:hypothetical protein [Victivallaceae bacterium]